jgi:hypothetical protein
MREDGPYTDRDLFWAVNGSAILGWLAVSAPVLLDKPAWLPWVAGIGLPTALVTCWIIARPVLGYVMQRSVSFPRAALVGAQAAALIALASIAVGRFLGWRQSLDDKFYSRIGGGDFVQEVDGILTPYGWQIVLQNSLLLVLIGAAIGVVIRLWIGPGRRQP